MDVSSMQLPDLYRALDATLDRLDPDSAETFAIRVREIAAMTTWAPGVIDPQGRAALLSLGLEARLKALFQKGGDNTVAELHDALSQLRVTIKRHDDDLNPTAVDADWDE
ncbi:MAG: hypothetical protein ACYDDA_13485 [Acidiferrobacteraceae bacterium]